jgi:acetylglutamate kinase
VVKFGGNAMKSESIIQNVVDNCLLLYETGIKVILVHGGGPDIDEELNKNQIQIEKIDGLRYTSKEVMDVVKRVLTQKTNADIVNRFNGKGAPLYGEFLFCEKKLSMTGADLGFVGSVKKVDLTPITEILAKDMIPVIASVGVGENGQDYNINADDVAAEIAKEINADKLLFLSDIDGVFDKDKNVISELSGRSCGFNSRRDDHRRNDTKS